MTQKNRPKLNRPAKGFAQQGKVKNPPSATKKGVSPERFVVDELAESVIMHTPAQPPNGVPSRLKRDAKTEISILKYQLADVSANLDRLIDTVKLLVHRVESQDTRLNQVQARLNSMPDSVDAEGLEALKKLVNEIDDRVNWLET